eukprot:gene7054-1260_t
MTCVAGVGNLFIQGMGPVQILHLSVGMPQAELHAIASITPLWGTPMPELSAFSQHVTTFYVGAILFSHAISL